MSDQTTNATANGAVAIQKPLAEKASRNGHSGEDNGTVSPLSDSKKGKEKNRRSRKTTRTVCLDEGETKERKEIAAHEQSLAVPTNGEDQEKSYDQTEGAAVEQTNNDVPAEDAAATEENSDLEAEQEHLLQEGTPPEGRVTNITTKKLLEVLRDKEGTRFFHDQHGSPFGWISSLPTSECQGHFECLPISSNAFRAKIIQIAELYSVNQPTAKVINDTIEAAKLLAFKEPKQELANRHQSKEDVLTIDMGDVLWKSVRVTANGWELVQQSEPTFFRPQHMRALPEPIGGGDPFELFEYVPADCEEDKLLILCWTVASFIPDVPSPILAFTGIQGSAKTTRSKRLRELIDPSITPVLGDLELSNLFLTFQHHAVPSFENVSKFDRRTADMFCRAVTGNGVERRKLFTNSDQVLYSFRRPIIINGIDTPSTRPDFLDRCIVINCRRLESFRPLRELDEAFQKARPHIFGSLLDLLVKSLNLMSETSPTGEFRMADFAHFGRALAVSLGRSPKDFDKAYRHNIRHQDKEALDASPMTNAVKSFASMYTREKPWTGSAQKLLTELRSTAHKNGDKHVMSDLPKSARWLSSRLSELVTALASEGVIIDRLPRTSSSRGWKVFMMDEARTERERQLNQPENVDEALAEVNLFETLGMEGSVDQS